MYRYDYINKFLFYPVFVYSHFSTATPTDHGQHQSYHQSENIVDTLSPLGLHPVDRNFTIQK